MTEPQRDRIELKLLTIKYRGVAQLVARDVWDVDAAGSNPVTPTNSGIHKAFEYQKSRF